MLKKLFIFIVAVLIVGSVAGVFIIRHIKPAEDLDLNYQNISIGSKVADIVKNRKLEVQVTEEDLNNLVKQQLAAHSELPNGIRVEGAKVTLQGANLVADLNVNWQDKVPVGAQLLFTLAWNPPNLIIEHQSTQVKGVRIPREWVQLAPIEIPIEEHLPLLIGVKDVQFQEKSIVVQLKALR
ncbi:hypothetical protein ACFPES_30565 [Paenibacillus sp. GCM10023248]|uniref:hypothetical protein n=1 Tax=Bacillales TaxID=1385 RepID=UPI00237899A0|nr:MULTISPECIES: hypothetical protein [Bacillales]MDD9271388.1 hypothetical protein [Paenibacillus sp. MAHUQ-63]MDR6881489.1 hypothetical protein [Bacillus sp. 3255]